MEPNLFAGAFGSTRVTGNVLRDPVLPPVSGMTVVKAAVGFGLFVWIVRRLGNR